MSEGGEQINKLFEVVGSIAECSLDNVYGCVENLLLEVLAIVSVIYGFIAVRKIMKDRNQILDLWDKVIVMIAYAQLIMLAVWFLFMDTQMWQFSIRTLFFANSILVCHTVFCIHELSDEAKQNLVSILKGAFAYLFALWFFCGFLHKNTPGAPYNCIRIDWMLLSGSNLILSCVLAFITLTIIQSIQDNTASEPAVMPQDGIQNYSVEDAANRKTQLTALLVGICLPSLVMFVWDYIANTHSASLLDCNPFFFVNSLHSLIIFLLAKIVCFFIPPFAIFFVFYWKNRKFLNTAQENPNGQYFFDRRSELLEKYTF